MARLWSLENKYQTWLQVELAHLEVLAEKGLIPKQAFQDISKNAKFDVSEILKLEEKVKHDVIAFITNVSENLGENGKYLHYGLTSSDVLDTAFALNLKQALQNILDEINSLQAVLKEKAYHYKNLTSVGRSHGIHAEPTSFGLKFALWYAEMKRNIHRLEQAKEGISFGKFSGAVGTFAHLSPQIEAKICEKLGLKPDPITTQVIQRDRHADVFSQLAILAGSLEKIALEIRHLQRTEVLEVEEPFTKGQKGSSAMPHKKNPIASENITGLARLVRSYAQASLENIALWHERDISHSSVERVIGPDSTILCDFMVSRLAKILEDLVVHEKNVTENLNKTHGLIYSQRVLLALNEKGVERQTAYEWIQQHAMVSWEEKKDFYLLLKEDKNISEVLTETELKNCFDPKQYLKHVDEIYQRVFQNE